MSKQMSKDTLQGIAMAMVSVYDANNGEGKAHLSPLEGLDPQQLKEVALTLVRMGRGDVLGDETKVLDLCVKVDISSTVTRAWTVAAVDAAMQMGAEPEDIEGVRVEVFCHPDVSDIWSVCIRETAEAQSKEVQEKLEAALPTLSEETVGVIEKCAPHGVQVWVYANGEAFCQSPMVER